MVYSCMVYSSATIPGYEAIFRRRCYHKKPDIHFAGKKSGDPVNSDSGADFKVGFLDRRIQSWLRQFWVRGIYRNNPNLAEAILQRFQQLRSSDFSHTDFVISARDVLAQKSLTSPIADGRKTLQENRTILRTGEILQLLDQFAPDWLSGEINTANKCYLDIGCGDAAITQKLADSLQLNPKHVMGLEITTKTSGESATASSVPVCYYDGVSLPVKDQSQDLVSSLMVLHHVKDPEAMMDEIVRVLKPGGLLLVREVDGSDPAVCVFNRLVDSYFYDVLSSDPSKQSMPCHYRSIHNWAQSFQARGLELIAKRRFKTNPAFEPPNLTQATYLLLRKPSLPFDKQA